MSHRIDLSSIDPASFRLLSQGDGVLIQPLRTKTTWRDDELPLRSLLLDPQGRVRSAGWPKFFNHGEHAGHDELFRRSLEGGSVEFAEKLDGALIIADGDEQGVSLRTRGQAGLGEFEAPVRALIEARYPRLPALLRDPRGPGAGHSMLFEYVAPDHTIVIRYDEPALYFLGAVCKRTLAPRWDQALRDHVERHAGVPQAPVHAAPTRLDEILSWVASMKDREGVVARCTTPDGRPLLLKLKAAAYLRIHGRRALLGERGALRMAFLMDLRAEHEVAPAFARVGLDHEAATYALASLRPYFAARKEADGALERLRKALAGASARPRREQIELARAVIAADPALAAPPWFAAAIKLLDGRDQDASLLAASTLIDEPLPTLRSWLRDRDATLAAMAAAAPTPDDTLPGPEPRDGGRRGGSDQNCDVIIRYVFPPG